MKELEDFLDAQQKAAGKIVPIGRSAVVGAWNTFCWTVPPLVRAVKELEKLYKAEMRHKHEPKTKRIQ